MAQSGEGKPRVLIAEFPVPTAVPPARGAADAAFRSEVVEPMRAEVASLRVPSCLAGTAFSHSHAGRCAQHGCR
jgi:hypothetical protein